MKKIINKNNLINLILILYTLSIVLDLHIFYNSISTLIRCGVITILFLIIFFKYSTKKERKYLIIYFITLFIYIGLHLLNIKGYYLSELLYFYKMCMSVLFIFVVAKLDIKLENFYKIINICLLMICGSILVCNLFKIGYTTYDFNRLNVSIYDWFGKNHYSFNEVSGKGYFHLANQIVSVVLLYLPILLAKLKNNINFSNVLTLVMSLLAMLIIGNRLSSAGPLIILVIGLFTSILLSIISKSKLNIKYIITLVIIMIGYNVLLFNSPLLKRYDYYDNLANTNEVINSNTNKNQTIITDKKIIDQFNDKLINLNFPLNYYPYDNDPEFWNNMLLLNKNILKDSRFLEINIVKRVKELNNNPFDKWVGLGYTKIINIQNIEQDFTMQYYSLGIVGEALTVGIYVILYLYLLFKVFINLEKKFNYENIMLLLGLGITIVGAYYSGNILNAVSSIIPIAFIFGIALNEFNKKIKTENKILGFNVYSKGKTELLKSLKKDLSNNKQNIIYNINPLIIANFYKNDNTIKEFNSQTYLIPDGIGVVLASKMKDLDINRTITGVELVEDICKLSIETKSKIYLYGSKEGVATKAKEVLEKTNKKIKIVGVSNGYISEKEALDNIIKAKPDILFIALGSPKQEEFIIKSKNKFSSIKIIMPVGGSLDVISGNIKRAPRVYSKLHLEWLYRMIKEPKRIRQDINLFKFIFLVIFRNNWYNERSKRKVMTR